MSSGGEPTPTIRLHGETYRRLKELKEDSETVLDALNKILPDDVDEIQKIERPESDVVAIQTPPDVSEQVKSLAGENVSANDVVDQLIEEYENE